MWAWLLMVMVEESWSRYVFILSMYVNLWFLCFVDLT